MLYLIGLGLGDAEDITLKGLKIVKSVDKVYLENYTSILNGSVEELEKLYGRALVIVDREMMEQGCKEILDVAESSDAAVLVVGDPLNATTHTDLLLRAASRSIPYKVIHNASIINAVAVCGLQVYNFGETVSIPFWTDTWKPASFYLKILRNLSNGLHTLCLLDIKVKEPNLELMVKGIQQFDPPRFMSVNQAAKQLLEASEEVEKSPGENSYQKQLNRSTICIGLARVGTSTQKIVKMTLEEATTSDFGPPLHSIVIPGDMHPIEQELIEIFGKEQ